MGYANKMLVEHQMQSWASADFFVGRRGVQFFSQDIVYIGLKLKMMVKIQY